MSFKISGSIADQRVTSGVTPVKTITGERRKVPKSSAIFFVNPFLIIPPNQFLLLCVKQTFDFFPMAFLNLSASASENPPLEPRLNVNLFLINYDAVSILLKWVQV